MWAGTGPKFCSRLEFSHFISSRVLFTQISWSIDISSVTEQAISKVESEIWKHCHGKFVLKCRCRCMQCPNAKRFFSFKNEFSRENEGKCSPRCKNTSYNYPDMAENCKKNVKSSWSLKHDFWGVSRSTLWLLSEKKISGASYSTYSRNSTSKTVQVLGFNQSNLLNSTGRSFKTNIDQCRPYTWVPADYNATTRVNQDFVHPVNESSAGLPC